MNNVFKGFLSEIEKLAAVGEGMGAGRPLGSKDKVPRRKGYTLKPYQTEAVQKLLQNDGKILLAHSPGSGKTLTSIEGFEALREQDKAHRALVITPAGLKKNYTDEGVSKFTNATVNNYSTSKLVDTMAPADYNVMSYEMFKRNPMNVINRLHPDTLILDEAHRARNRSSSNYKSLMKIRPYVRNVIQATGSPISNSPADIMPLMDIVSGDEAPKITGRELLRKTVKYIPAKPGIFGFFKKPARWDVDERSPYTQEIQKYTDLVTLDEVGTKSMPKKTVEEVKIPMNDKQKQLFDFSMGKLGWYTKWKVKHDLPLTQHESSSVLQQMQQARAVSNGIHTLDRNVSLSQSAAETPKITQLMGDVKEHLKTVPDAQIVIYSNLIHGGVDVVAQGLKDANIPFGLFIGKANEGITEKTRDQDVADFKAGKKKVIILSGAGVEGLSFNDATFHASLDGHFNPEVIKQSEARSVRLGGQSKRPEGKRQVMIKRYMTVFPEEWMNKWFDVPTGPAMDEKVYAKAMGKAKVNKIFEEVLAGPDTEKTAGFKKWLATGALGASLLTPGKIHAGENVAQQIAKNRTVHEAVWKQYEATRAARAAEASKTLNFAQYDPRLNQIEKATQKGTRQVSSVAPVAPQDTRNVLDKTIDRARELENKTGLRIRQGGITKKIGSGSVTLNKQKQLSGEYNFGGLNVRGNPKGVDEVSQGFGKFRAYVRPQKKEIGIGFGTSF